MMMMMMKVKNKEVEQKRDADIPGVSEGRVKTTTSNFRLQNLFFSFSAQTSVCVCVRGMK